MRGKLRGRERATQCSSTDTDEFVAGAPRWEGGDGGGDSDWSLDEVEEVIAMLSGESSLDFSPSHPHNNQSCQLHCSRPPDSKLSLSF